jgi:tetratricopeptide (TPR) repeat protein
VPARSRRVEGGGRRAVSRRLAARPLVVALLITVAACAKKPVTVPVAPGAPHFPEYVFPAAPPPLSVGPVADQHAAAWQVLQSGDPKAADREFTTILKASPGFYPAEAGLGYAALARRDAGAAIGHFDKALAANATYAPALAGKGDALLSQGHAESALEAFQAALTADASLTAVGSRIDALKFRLAQDAVTSARKAADAGRFDEARRLYEGAIAASPESAFLHRELALVQRKAGDTAAAIDQAQQAAKLDPGDARALALIAEIYEGDKQWAKAADAYAAVNAIEPSEAVASKIDQMRQKAALDLMPADYKSIDAAPSVTRAQLAALLGVHLEDLLRRARGSNAVVTTDIRSNWAAPWIMAVTRAGVMEPFPNHTFQPNTMVRRGDLAAAVSRVLSLIATEKPRLAARWRDPRPTFSDLPPAHLSYPAAARSVSAGVMTTLGGDTFQLAREVTGAEAVDAVTKLEGLAKK